VAVFYFVMLLVGIGAVLQAFPFAVGFGTRRRDFVLGTLAMGIVACAAWAILLGLLSLIEANVIKNWGVGLHFFHLPYFSDGSLLRQFCWSYYRDAACAHSDPNYVRGGAHLGQFWVYFVFLLFMYLLGLLLGSIYQRFGRTGEYIFAGIAFLLLSVFLLVNTNWHWWGAIFGWLAQQTAATLGLWLLPLIAICALGSYALLRKATV
jgi:ABC-type Na+ efflux pump permease subunit